MSAIVKRRIGVSRSDRVENQDKYILKKKKRIPVSKIYWKKGDYEELVEDPFNTGRSE